VTFLNPAYAVPIRLSELAATLTAADTKDHMTLNFDCEIFRIHVKMGNTGSTPGNNDFVLNYTPPTGGVTTAGDLWTVAAGVGRIAFDGAKYLEFDRDDCDITYLEAGGTLDLDVDAVPAGTPVDLEVTLWVYPTNVA